MTAAPDPVAAAAPVAPRDGWRPALAPAILLRCDRVRSTDLLVLPERVVVLSGRAGAIVRLCDGDHSVPEIVGELAERFPGAPVDTDVPAFIDRLRAEGWLR